MKEEVQKTKNMIIILKKEDREEWQQMQPMGLEEYIEETKRKITRLKKTKQNVRQAKNIKLN